MPQPSGETRREPGLDDGAVPGPLWAEDRFLRQQFSRGRARQAQRQIHELWSRLLQVQFRIEPAEAAETRLQTLEMGDVLLSTLDFGDGAQSLDFTPAPERPGALMLVRAIQGGSLTLGKEAALALPAGQIVLVPLRHAGRLRLGHGGRCDVGLIQTSPRLPEGVCIPGGGVPSLHHLGFIAGYLLRCAPHPEGRTLRLKEMLLEALEHVVSDLARPVSAAGETDFERFKFLVSANLSRADLTLGDLAQAMQMSPRRLQRLLQAQGTQFRSHLLQRRLEQAHELIQSAGAARPRVADLAYRCGFSDPNYFSRAYAQRWKSPPSRE